MLSEKEKKVNDMLEAKYRLLLGLTNSFGQLYSIHEPTENIYLG